MSLLRRHRTPVPRELAAWERQVRDQIYGGPRSIVVLPKGYVRGYSPDGRHRFLSPIDPCDVAAPLRPPTPFESPRTVGAAEGVAHGSSTSHEQP